MHVVLCVSCKIVKINDSLPPGLGAPSRRPDGGKPSYCSPVGRASMSGCWHNFWLLAAVNLSHDFATLASNTGSVKKPISHILRCLIPKNFLDTAQKNVSSLGFPALIGPLPFRTRAPTLPPLREIFLGFFVFHVRVFFLISRILASTYVTVAPTF